MLLSFKCVVLFVKRKKVLGKLVSFTHESKIIFLNQISLKLESDFQNYKLRICFGKFNRKRSLSS